MRSRLMSSSRLARTVTAIGSLMKYRENEVFKREAADEQQILRLDFPQEEVALGGVAEDEGLYKAVAEGLAEGVADE